MGTRGYRNYRGKGQGRAGKIFLIVLLVVVILASMAYLFLQNFVVYDSKGNMILDLPFLKGETVEPEVPQLPDPDRPEEDKDELTLIIDRPEPPKEEPVLRAAQLPLSQLTEQSAPPEGCNALVTELKGETGTLFYQSAYRAEGAQAPDARSQEEIAAALGGEREWTAVAALHTLHDTGYAFANMAGAGLCQPSGYIWYDNTNTHWLEPSKEAARSYLAGLARECVDMGFDEILLRELGYPTRGKQFKINFADMTCTKEEALGLVLRDVREAVGEETLLSIQLTEELILAGSDEASGQSISVLAPMVDRVYVATENPDAVWDALSIHLPEGTVRETFLVVMDSKTPETGSWIKME